MTPQELRQLAGRIDLNSMCRLDLALAFPFRMTRIVFRFDHDGSPQMGLVLLPAEEAKVELTVAASAAAFAVAESLKDVDAMLAVSYVTAGTVAKAQGLVRTILAAGMSADGRTSTFYAADETKPREKLVPTDFVEIATPADPLLNAITQPWRKDGMFGLSSPNHAAFTSAAVPSSN